MEKRKKYPPGFLEKIPEKLLVKSREFGALSDYAEQYSRPVGYIVLFKNIEQEIKFNFSSAVSGVNYVDFNGKRIFFLLVDIFDYEESTSQRGKREVVGVNEADLFTVNNSQ